MREAKVFLRRELLKKRRDLPNRHERDADIFGQLIALPEFSAAETVLTYYSFGAEPDTLRLISRCFELGKIVGIPVIVNDEMVFIRLYDDFTSDYRQLATADCRLCIVPALAYNRENYRLGYGGGYYDRFLQDYTGYKIGLCCKELITDIPVEEHDEKVDIVLWN
jgi:5-formyltetrahydrofolate cyclo-ligase